jgi:methyl-accepting chemotaxis protein
MANNSMANNDALPQNASDLIASIRQNALLLVIDAEGRIREANPLLLQCLGLAEAAVVGASLADLMFQTSVKSAEFRKLIRDVFKGRNGSGVLRLQAAGGDLLPVSASFHPIGDGADALATIIGTALIADQLVGLDPDRTAQDQLIQGMVRITYAADGAIKQVNPHGLSLLGYRLADLRGKQEEVLLTTTVFEAEKCQEKWRDLRSGKAVTQQCHCYAQDGSDVFIQATYQPVLDDQGNVSQIVMLGCDVTPIERRLRKAFAMMEKKSAALNEALQEAREAHQMREEMDRALQAMSTPVTPIWDEVLLLPLVGIIDSTRTDDAMKTTLDKISSTGAKMFILDISGVPSVDTAVANQLIKITKATKIMGCDTIVSGVSSAIAHTIVDLGIDIGEMTTTSSLRDAVAISLERVTAAKKEKKKSKKISKKAKNSH